MEIASTTFFSGFIFTYIVFAIVWFYQFVQLMLMKDSDFPGKYDKILWGVAFIGAFFVVPFAFICWKQAYLSSRIEKG